MSNKRADVLAALERGDFAVEYRLPENVEVREVEGVGTIFVVDDMVDPFIIDSLMGDECKNDDGTVTAYDCDTGGCTVTVCGIAFEGFNGAFAGFNGRLGDECIVWQCDDEEMMDGDQLDEEIAAALTNHVTIYDKVDEDEVEELCAAYAGKTRDEIASRIYPWVSEDIPGEEREWVVIGETKE